MKIGILAVALAGLLTLTHEAGGLEAESDPAAWSFSVATGYDTYIHTFPLATDDTTETVTELTVSVGAEGRTAGRARHHWLLRPELSLGTELLRERLDFGYQFRPDSSAARFRFDARLNGRQYKGGTDYSLTSDNLEGRAEARAFIDPAGATVGELRAHLSALRYADPSVLEIDHDEWGLAAFVGSGPKSWRRYRAGLRFARRAYPDSSAIDRTVLACEGEYDNLSFLGPAFRLYHRSERRLIADETKRPSAWAHWSELNGAVPIAEGRLAAELQSEVWWYDLESSAYFNSWRFGGHLALEGGNVLAVAWQAGPAIEWLLAGADSPESYLQYGIRVGAESYGRSVSGSLTLEYGRRSYSLEPVDGLTAVDLASTDIVYTYSDFNYWEIWLMANFLLSQALSFDVMANYQPESHTEKTDDMSIAFANARFVWRW